MRSFAIFDLDHTLLPFDTQALFCNFVIRREPWRVALHAIFVPVGLARALGLADTVTARRAFHAYLWRMPSHRLTALAREFAATEVVPAIRPEILGEIDRHAREGRVLVLNTASPDFIVREIGAALGFAHTVATHFEIGHRMPLMPEAPRGDNRQGAKLVSMIREVPGIGELTAAERAQCWCYSDHQNDLPLLEFVGHPVAVEPSPRLNAIARKRGWSILNPAGPRIAPWRRGFDALRQALGLYRR